MGGHSKARVAINSEVVDNGGRCNNIIPHIERDLRNLKLPSTRGDPYYLCFGWVKLELIGTSTPLRHTPLLFAGAVELQMGQRNHKFVCHQHRGVDVDGNSRPA